MSETTRVTYRGPAFAVSALAQILEEEGASVRYTPPMETRGMPEVAEAVIVSLACSGAYDVIKAGVAKFRATRFGQRSAVEIEGDDEQAE